MEKYDDITFKLEHICPKCNWKMDALTNFENNGIPDKGDIAICINCLQILQFDSNLKLVIVTDEEFVDFPCEDRTAINKMIKALIYARNISKSTTKK